MKSFYKAGIISLVLMLALSCVNSEETRITSFAYKIYSLTAHTVVDEYVILFDRALKVDIWLNAQDEEQRYEIEDLFFGDNKIRKVDNKITISNMGSFLINSATLHESGAEWIYSDESGTSTFTKVNEGWTITSNKRTIYYNAGEVISSVNLNIRAENISQEMKQSERSVFLYTLNGSGDFYEINGNAISEIGFILEREVECFLWEEDYWTIENYIHYFKGVFLIDVHISPENNYEEVRAILDRSTYYDETVEIYYQGVSEIW